MVRLADWLQPFGCLQADALTAHVDAVVPQHTGSLEQSRGPTLDAGRIKDGSHLPAGCVVQLDKLFSAQPATVTKAPRCAGILDVL